MRKREEGKRWKATRRIINGGKREKKSSRKEKKREEKKETKKEKNRGRKRMRGKRSLRNAINFLDSPFCAITPFKEKTTTPKT